MNLQKGLCGMVLISFLVLNAAVIMALPGSHAKDPEVKSVADDAEEKTNGAEPQKNDKKPDDPLTNEPARQDKTSEDADQRPVKNKIAKRSPAFFDPTSREYVALFAGYGGYFPVADYGSAYKPGHLVSFTAGVYYINLFGLSPEVHCRYAAMDYKDDPMRYRARLSQVQVYPAIVYRYPFKLPRNTLTVYGRIWDGLSRIYYTSRDPYLPIFKRNIIENLNVFGVSAGCYYDAWKGFLVGIDLSYSIVSTARKPLQSLSLSVIAGWRVL
ncbi:MAG: hypothetical protein KA369_00445 [Spirochaetes bacterium]|nr:hypothetical protein [Spirochaetota bacterium]